MWRLNKHILRKFLSRLFCVFRFWGGNLKRNINLYKNYMRKLKLKNREISKKKKKLLGLAWLGEVL
jgi:hypothetical protein